MRRPPEIQENFIDKAIAYVAPGVALKRRRDRMGLAMTGGYVGASKSKRSMSEWNTRAANADSAIIPDLETLRDRSRDLSRNNPLAGGAINTKITNVVGTGLRLQSRIDAEFLGMTDAQAEEFQKTVEREFGIWAKECDIERSCSFWQLQNMVFRGALESGDIFTLMPYLKRKGEIYGTKIQIIEADRVSNPRGERQTDTFAGGVEKDQYGAPFRYWVTKQHPGSINPKSLEWQSFDAFGQSGRRNMLHHFRKLRPGQSRGVPDLAPVIESLKQLGTYSEAEVSAAVVSAMFTVFVKSEGGQGVAPMMPTDETGGSSSDDDYKLSPAAILELMPGEDISTASPGRPNANFDPFVMAILRQVGVALELPFEILVKHFTASYSAARAALLEAWKFFMVQRQWLAETFCQPVYETWLTEAVASGRIYAPGFLNGDPAIRHAYCNAEWIGPARGQIDELKEIKAAVLRVNMGVSTLAEETAQLTGGDWEMKHRQRVKEQRMREEGGLSQQVQTDPSEDENFSSDEDSEDDKPKRGPGRPPGS